MTSRRLQPGCRQEGQDRRAGARQAQEPGTQGPPLRGLRGGAGRTAPGVPKGPAPTLHQERPRPLSPPRSIMLVDGLSQKTAKATCGSVEVD